MDLNLIRNISQDTQVFWIKHKIGILICYYGTKGIHIFNRIYANLCLFSNTFFDLSYGRYSCPMFKKRFRIYDI